MMEAGLVAPDSVRWRQALEHIRHDVYHLPEYVAFASRHEEAGEPVAFVAEDGPARMVVPMILRPVPAGFGEAAGAACRDATSPRGYAGPVLSSDGTDGSFAVQALAGLRQTLCDAGVVSLFSRLHPFLSPPPAALERLGSLVDHGESMSVDLAASDEDWRRGLRENHRRDIARASRGGYVARSDDAWAWLDGFVGLYEATMRRLGAADEWRLPAAYFHDLRATLGDRLHLCVVERDGDLAAGGLLTEVDGIVEYHLAATAPGHVGASPSKLIVDFARRWARERGDRVLHLAGSLGPGDSLQHFKLGFSPRRHAVRSWRLVTDAARYDGLVRAWEAVTGAAADTAEGFFPAYRKPAAEGS